MTENADEFDSKCSEYVTFAPPILLLDESGTAQHVATASCIQVHYFRSAAGDRGGRPDRALDLTTSAAIIASVIAEIYNDMLLSILASRQLSNKSLIIKI